MGNPVGGIPDILRILDFIYLFPFLLMYVSQNVTALLLKTSESFLNSNRNTVKNIKFFER